MLVWIYLFICRRSGRIEALAQRQSNNSEPDLADEAVLTVYLFGLVKKRKTVRAIHDYTAEQCAEWFPEPPSYQSYNRRLNRMSAVFAPLVRETLSKIDCAETFHTLPRRLARSPGRWRT